MTVTDPGDLDIDHIVPLAEAARSGARRWPEERRRAFANDPDVLVAVTATSNRQKGDQDPAEWLPDRDRCGYVARWVRIKHTYGLTADQAEADTIRSVLRRCR
ncbi:HNH endonuclease family protein [Prauserella shujinwangii]|uniref:HNH endonuclease family protein n=1 Tax=Prauserella shujinwangii TaxID=1453103 RepID=UPI001FE6EFD3|nr:HNH endonuclease family protein [Prauserella shujinwangii]